MAGRFKKILRFFAYPILRPAEQILESGGTIAKSLKDAAGNPVEKEDLISFDEALRHREEIADRIEVRERERQRISVRMGLVFFGVFFFTCLWGLLRLIFGALDYDIVAAKEGAYDFLIGLAITAGAFFWIKSFTAKRELPTLHNLLRQFILIKRILITFFIVTFAVFIVNTFALRFMGALLSFSALFLIMSWNFRYSLRIWQLKQNRAVPVNEYFKVAGWRNLFDFELA